MIVPHILFGVICGILGILVAVGTETALLHWIAFYSLAGNFGLVVSVSLGVLLEWRARRIEPPNRID